MKIDFARLQVRKASTDELDLVVSVLDDATRWIQGNGVLTAWKVGSFEEETHERIKDGEVYVGVYEGLIVGTFRLQVRDKLYWGKLDIGNDYAYVHKLAVGKDFHGQGLGLRMLRSAESLASDMGKKFIRLDCMNENMLLRDYYENAGYKPMGVATIGDHNVQLFEKRIAKQGQGLES